MTSRRSSGSRLADVALCVLVAGALTAAMNAQSLLERFEGVELGLTGRARLTGSSPARAAASLAQKVLVSIENVAYDRRLEWRAHFNPCPLDPRPLIVEIDDRALQAFGRWPWPRDRLASLVACLRDVGAQGVFLDIEMPEPAGERQDQALARALAPGQGFASFGVMFQSDRDEPSVPAAVASVTSGSRVTWPAQVERHLRDHPTAQAVDLVLAGRIPDWRMPRPVDTVPPVHPSVLLPALLEILEQGPELDDAKLWAKALEATGAGPSEIEAIRALPFGRDYLPLLVRFARDVSKPLQDLQDVIDRSVDDTVVAECVRVRAAGEAIDRSAFFAAVFARCERFGARLAPRLPGLVDRFLSGEAVWRRDRRQAQTGPTRWSLPSGDVTLPIATIAGAYAGIGISTVARDPDGILRRQALLFGAGSSPPGSRPAGRASPKGEPDRGQRALESCWLQAILPAATHMLSLDPSRLEWTRQGLTIPSVRPGGGISLAADELGRVLIDFRGRWGLDGFERVSGARILELVGLQSRMELFLGEDQAFRSLTAVLDRVAPLKGPQPSWSLPGAGAIDRVAARDLLAPIRDKLSAEQGQLRSVLLEQMRMDLQTYPRALDEARAAGDEAEVRELEAKIRRAEGTYRALLIETPIKRDALARLVKGRFCLIGLTATSTTDISAIPLQERYINLGVHANLLNQILVGSPLRRLDRVLFDLPILLFFALLVPLVTLLLSIRNSAIAVLVMAAAHAGVSTWLLVRHGLVVGMVTPILAIGCGYFLLTLRRYLMEERQKTRIRAMFETYLDRRVVEAMVEDEALWRELGGTSREITAFFSDIEGFTTISELLEAGELSEMLVEYLTPMTAVILGHEGLRDKYIGDAIVACFGAPYPYPDHAVKACLAAIEQQEVLGRLKADWAAGVGWYAKIRERGLDLAFRIGLNTGPAKVGNFGSRDSKNWTMIGDTVNLASRLEGANKGYRTRVMISETTWVAARGAVEARELDLLRVVGKNEPVRVYELLGRRGWVDERVLSLARRFGEALALYRARGFDEARRLFGEIGRDHPGDGPTRTYLSRLANEEFLKGLPPDWDGTFTSKEK